MKNKIQHIWFDFSDTLARRNEKHDELTYCTYSEQVGKPVTPELIEEFKSRFKRYKSTSAVFHDMGLPASFWSETVLAADPGSLYSLMDEDIPAVLDELRKKYTISIFSNMQTEKLLPAIGINPSWFTLFLSSADIARPKPFPDGFYKIVELSKIPAENILFIGDHIEKEMMPAKEAGLQTGIMWQEAPEADYSFKDFQEVRKVLL